MQQQPVVAVEHLDGHAVGRGRDRASTCGEVVRVALVRRARPGRGRAARRAASSGASRRITPPPAAAGAGRRPAPRRRARARRRRARCPSVPPPPPSSPSRRRGRAGGAASAAPRRAPSPAPSPPAFWRAAAALIVVTGGGVLGVGRPDPGGLLAVVVALHRLPRELALLLGRRGEEREADEAVGGEPPAPAHDADAAVGGRLDACASSRAGPRTRTAARPWGSAARPRSCAPRVSPGTSSSNCTGSPGAASVGVTWTCAAAGAAAAASAASARARRASDAAAHHREPEPERAALRVPVDGLDRPARLVPAGARARPSGAPSGARPCAGRGRRCPARRRRRPGPVTRSVPRWIGCVNVTVTVRSEVLGVEPVGGRRRLDLGVGERGRRRDGERGRGSAAREAMRRRVHRWSPRASAGERSRWRWRCGRRTRAVTVRATRALELAQRLARAPCRA